MKKKLIVPAHPEDKSFCSSLKNRAIEYFKSAGAEVRIHDLYASSFNPVGDKDDFIELKKMDYFKYQLEQVNAYENGLFKEPIQAHMDDFEWCDTLIFSFPLWWFGLPAILKGWVDRVFAMGFAYGNGKGVYENGAFPDKTSFIIMTTGGPDIAYNGGKNGNLDDILFPMHHGMFYFVGMTVLPPFISFSPARKTQEEREDDLNKLTEYLSQIKHTEPIYTNRN